MKPQLIAIGYWNSIYEPEFPDPINFEDSNWNLAERNLVIEHLKKGTPIFSWVGSSWCRYRCKESNMGAHCLTDGKYIFPEKLVHYIKYHNIKPPIEFIEHVLSYRPLKIFSDSNEYEINYEWWKKKKQFNNVENKKTFLTATEEEFKMFQKRTKGYKK
jgi:hypothetical protein